MKSKPCELCGAWFGAAVLSFPALWFAYGQYWPALKCWINANQGMASWVQAIGSIAAVLGTWWATTYQIRKARMAQDALRVEQARMSMERELDINKICQELARDLEKLCQQHMSMLAQQNWQQLRQHVKSDELAKTLDIIGTYTSHYVPVRLAFKMLQLLRIGQAIAKQFERHAQMVEIAPGVRDQFDSLRVAVCKLRGEIKAQRKEIRTAYGKEGVESAPDPGDHADMPAVMEDTELQFAGLKALQQQSKVPWQ